MKDLPDNFTGSKRMSVEDSLAYGPRPKISRTMTANAPERQGILYIPKNSNVSLHIPGVVESLEGDHKSFDEQFCILEEECLSR